MENLDQKIGFIGAGNMAEAMIGAVINTNTCSPENIFVSDINSERINQLCTTYSIKAVSDNLDIVNQCQIVIFAVKPQQINSVLTDIADREGFIDPDTRKIFISIAAGIRIKTFEEAIYLDKSEEMCRRLPVLRVMPNTPALVCAGMCALCSNKFADSNDLEITRRLLAAMGEVTVVDEDKMDAVTALSGSGPAYCYYMIESMISAGEQLGFSTEEATELTLSTFSGALRLLEARPLETAESLRQKVTSPGGTTEAALSVFNEHKMKETIISAVFAAAERSRQLSNEA